jgi:hypothetical protein
MTPLRFLSCLGFGAALGLLVAALNGCGPHEAEIRGASAAVACAEGYPSLEHSLFCLDHLACAYGKGPCLPGMPGADGGTDAP